MLQVRVAGHCFTKAVLPQFSSHASVKRKRTVCVANARFVMCVRRVRLYKIIGSFSNDNGDGNENVTNLHIQWAKTIALRALHVRFSFLSISLPSSAKQQREITKFEVLRRTSALGGKFSFFSPKFSAARNGFIPEGPPHLCHIKKLGIVAK